MPDYDFIVIGGGWAGILSANELSSKYPGSKIAVLEQSERGNLGGLLHSEVVNGFTFDTGGPHILFSRNKKILQKNISFLGRNVYSSERRGAIFFNGDFIKYPFENGIFSLPAQLRAEIGLGLIESVMRAKGENWIPSNFKEWIYGLFGDAMGRSYLEPYNKKIWKRDLAQIDADWVFSPGRLPLPNLEDLVKAVAGIETTGYKEQSLFYYPKTGGIQAMYNSLLAIIVQKGVTFIENFPVISIRRKGDNWDVNGKFNCRKIINTIPLEDFLKLADLGDLFGEFRRMFDYNSVAVVGIGFDSPGHKHHAVYVPSEKIIFHRYTWMSNLTTDSPLGKSNLIAETTIPKGKEIRSDKILSETIEGLEKLGIINNDRQVVIKKIWINKYGYPIYVRNHGKMREDLFLLLHDKGIYSVGRWGSWHYWNTDKVHEAVLKEISLV